MAVQILLKVRSSDHHHQTEHGAHLNFGNFCFCCPQRMDVDLTKTMLVCVGVIDWEKVAFVKRKPNHTE